MSHLFRPGGILDEKCLTKHQKTAQKVIYFYHVFFDILGGKWAPKVTNIWTKMCPKITYFAKLYFRSSFRQKNMHFALTVPSVNLKSTRQGRCFLDVASFPPWRSSYRKMSPKTPQTYIIFDHRCLKKIF